MRKIFFAAIAACLGLYADLAPGVNIAGPYADQPSTVGVSINDSGNALAIWIDYSTNTCFASYYQGGVWGSPAIVGASETITNAPLNDSNTAWAIIQDSTSNRSLHAVYFDGSGWGSSTIVSGSQTVYSDIIPKVAYNNSNQAIVVWSGSDGYIYANVNNNGGGWQSLPIQVSTVVNSNSPSVSISDNQMAIVVWEDDSSSPDQIYYATYDFQTDMWSTPVPVSSSANSQSFSLYCFSPLAMNESGGAALVWTEDTVSDQVFASIYNGTMWGTSTNLSNIPSSDFTEFSSVGISSSGEAVAIWRHVFNGGPVTNTIETAVYSGGMWSSPTTISPTTDYSSNGASIAVNGPGGALGAWIQVYVANEHSEDEAVYVSTYNAGTWSSSTALSSTTTGTVNDSYYYSSVGLNNSGTGVVAWYYYDGIGNYYIQASIGPAVAAPEITRSYRRPSNRR